MRFALTLAALVMATPAIASEPAAPPAKEKPKKICKRLEVNTGSHMGGSGRTCLTAEGWAKLDRKGTSNSAMMVEKRTAED